MERTDFELIQAFCAGETVAADELVRRHLPRLRSLMYQLVLDADAADDLTQEAFTRALQGVETFRGNALFATWLHRIALNVAYRFLRQADRHRTCELPDGVADGGASPQDGISRTEGRDRIARALGRLAPALRTAIVLTVMQDHSAVEAAEIEGCSVGTMYWRIHEARRRLRDDLKDWIE